MAPDTKQITRRLNPHVSKGAFAGLNSPEPIHASTALHLIQSLYVHAPHVALYTPYCKIRDMVMQCTFFAATDGKHLTAVIARSPAAIELTWAQSGRETSLQNLITKAMRRGSAPAFVPLLEASSREWSDVLQLPLLGRCFRAVYSGPPVARPEPPRGYVIRDCDFGHDLDEAASLLCASYPSLRDYVTADGLRAMMDAHFHLAAGWFFLVHLPTRRKIGLAISGYDPELDEGFIDWVGVLPSFRQRGLGRLLVYESIRRLIPARMITVSGPLDAPFVTGDLYRRCGFSQLRQWTVLGQSWRAPLGLQVIASNGLRGARS